MRTLPRPSSAPTIATVTWVQTRLGLEIAKGAADFAARLGWGVIRLDNYAPLAVSALRRAKVDGLVVQAFDDAPVQALLKLGRPLVNVSNARPDWTLPKVVSDDEQVGRLAADYYLGKGFRSFAFCGNEQSGTSVLRKQGFASRLSEQGFTAQIMPGNCDLPRAYLSAKGVDDVRKWLKGLPKPCGLFAWHDNACDMVANFCQQEGIRVPQELSLLGVNNDFRLQDDESQAISSIELSGHAIGQHAARVLSDWLAGRPLPREPLRLPPLRIVERRSTDFHAVPDPAVQAGLRFIRQNFQRPIGVEDIAGAAMLSRRILEKRFRSLLRISPYEELMRWRVERAKDLLLGTSLKLEDIARLCGYEAGSNFSLFFLRKTGWNPSEFRTRRGNAV